MTILANPASNIGVGRKTVTAAGTAEALSTSNAPVTSVTIQAESDNTNNVAVGGEDVVAAAGSEEGIVLGAGQSITLNVRQLSKVWVDAVTNGEGVTYITLS